MVKVKYPNGKILNFARIKENKGYFYRHGKVYTYLIPKKAKVIE